ncbi:MAG: alpha-amylase family glycosyl hydrolase [Mobilitalea sp.]
MKKERIYRLVAIFVILSILPGCAASTDKVSVPKWSDNAAIYEVNIRQYTEEGTFKAFEEHLPRLKEMGVKILWFMPIYPISSVKRLGSLGSYYAIADYQEINPEFGTKEDFEHLVKACHEMGFKVILDWVANHTGWDNAWITEHPDWYTKNAQGGIIYPETWEDVADLNYENEKLQKAMIKAMTYWVKEFDVDGYRCDYAGGVPLEFWEEARTKLERIKPVYMLAEDDKSQALMKYAFNSNYGWSLYQDLNSVAKGSKKADSLVSYFKNTVKNYPEGTYPLHFIDNHDENSWNGTVEERMGVAQQAMLALIFTVPGMPLIYSGQEVNLDHRLEFFDKDEIVWEDFQNEELLTKLIHLKLEHPALWNGNAGGEITFLESSSERVLVYERQKDEDRIVVLLNLSDKAADVKFKMVSDFEGMELMTAESMTLVAGENERSLEPWEYLVISK